MTPITLPSLPSCPRCHHSISEEIANDETRICCAACGLRVFADEFASVPLAAPAQMIMDQLAAIATATGTPEAYARDLWVCDRQDIAGGISVFAWGLYENGTHLIAAGRPDGSRLCAYLGTSFAGYPLSWYWCNGRTVRPMTLERTVQHLAEHRKEEGA